jgi:signal transduction histidine kinase
MEFDHPESDTKHPKFDPAEVGSQNFTTQTRCNDGGFRWISWATSSNHNLIYASGRDIIDERASKKHLEAVEEHLRQAQKVQAIGQLAGGIAHDFNNILQAVSGAARLIERQAENLDKTRHFARMVIAAADRGASITHRLLAFARRGELRPGAINTADLLYGLSEVLVHTLGTTITVGVVIPPDVPALLADRAQLETAIINLGTNARDAMPKGGTLTLCAEAERVGEDERHPAGLVPGDYVRLSVVDTGTGMDAATLARVGEPFFTTKPPGRGTGLGMAMAKGLAEQSGGGLSIDSAEGKGTTVTLWLPQADDMVARLRTDEDGAPAVIGAARVMVVDDDDLVRESVAEQLEAEGFAALAAASGVEALALLASGEVVDALVSDLSMPGMNGLVTIEKVREMRPRLPCFLLTGYTGDGSALSGDGSFTLIRKPVSGRALVTQIAARLASARP